MQGHLLLRQSGSTPSVCVCVWHGVLQYPAEVSDYSVLKGIRIGEHEEDDTSTVPSTVHQFFARRDFFTSVLFAKVMVSDLGQRQKTATIFFPPCFPCKASLIPLDAKVHFCKREQRVRPPVCLYIVSVFVCLASVVAFREVRNCLFKCSGPLQQTHSELSYPRRKHGPKIYLEGNEEQCMTNPTKPK